MSSVQRSIRRGFEKKALKELKENRQLGIVDLTNRVKKLEDAMGQLIRYLHSKGVIDDTKTESGIILPGQKVIK